MAKKRPSILMIITKLIVYYYLRSLKSMDNKTLQYFINFLRQLIESEKSLQFTRRQLLSIKFYNPLCIFDKIAGKDRSISINAMQLFVKDKITCNQRQLYEIFQKFDHKRQGQIDVDDFFKQLSWSSKKAEKVKGKINYEIESKFIEYLHIIVKSCRVVDVWRKQLQSIEPYRIFEIIDINLDGLIGPQQLATFFKKYSSKLENGNSRLLYQVLKRRHYSQINLQVFCENLRPLQNGEYYNYKHALRSFKQQQLNDKNQKYIQSLAKQQTFYNEQKNNKVIELVHKQASLLRQQQLQNRVKQQLTIFQDLKYLTRKKYHPQLSYDRFLQLQKENLERMNLQIQIMRQQQIRRQMQYKQKLKQVDIVRQVQAFERSKIQRLPFSTVQNRIDSSLNTHHRAQLQQKIKKYKINQLNRQKKTPIYRNTPIFHTLNPRY